jgi:hypothetical protein
MLIVLELTRQEQSLYYALPGFLRGQPRQFFREFWVLQDILLELELEV